MREGQKHSPESIAKMVEAATGRKWSEERKQAARGRKLSASHRDKISESVKRSINDAKER